MQTLPALDQALREAVDRKEIPGAVAIATTDREIIYEAAFGKRDLGQDAEMTVDSVFCIASMTKAITTAAAMQLVEQGKLSFDEPIGTLLPELMAVQVLEGFDEAGTPRLRAPRGAITLKHLMTHTAGFCYDMWNADMVRYMAYAELPGIMSCSNKALTAPLVADPGERWEYGIAIDFVGKAVEAASGKTLDAYLRDHIFSPLRMNDTVFKLGAEQRRRLVGMHARGADGALQPIPLEIPQDPEFFMGGGGLYGTGHDYIRFIRMLLNAGTLDGNQVLRPETVATMAQNHIGDLNVTRMVSALPALTHDVELFPEQDKKWGLSFLINTQRTAEGRSPGSLAWAGLANTYFWLDPARKIGGLILMQFLPFADPKALQLFSVLERSVYSSLDDHKVAA